MTYTTRAAVVVVALALASCQRAAPPERDDFVGVYSPADSHVVGLERLYLGAEGEYEGWVLNGISSFGCGDVVGAGFSTGDWRFEQGRVVLEPENETDRLIVTFANAHAALSAGGLRLSLASGAYDLRRETGPIGPLVPRSR